ncbi:MAG: tetratricopeptide repeat protein, partial [Anaerolineae bacterium]
ETIAHICRLVEGLPLGIELASAWARTMTGAQILEAINQSVDALATTRRDVPARHRSLRATFTYSWAMLSPEEQRVFCDLSVFRGGFTAAATPASLQMLSSLVEKSLLRQDADGRYQMHELLRQFGEEKLRQHPEAEAIARNHHCAWVADFLQQWDTALRGKRQMEAVEQIGAEIDNIRTGWQWAVKNGKEAEISRSFRAIAQFFDIRGWFQEGESMFAKAAAALPEKGVLYGRLLGYQAGFNYRSGRYERAQSLFEETLTLFLQLNEPDESAFVLNGLGALASFRGQYAEAKQHAKKSLAIARKTNDPYEESKSLDVLGIAARYNGQLSEAKAYFQASLIIHQNHGDLFGLARSYNHLGNTAFAEKEYDNAITLFTQAMEICRKIDYRFVIPYLLNNLGISAGHMKKYDESIQYFSEGLALFQKLGDQFGEGLVYGNLGHIFESAGENAKAAKHFKSAIRIGLELGSPALVLDALTGIATLLAKDDEMQQALELATLIMHHSATRKETKQKAEALSNQLMDALPSDQVASALAKGEALRLTEISAKILA